MQCHLPFQQDIYDGEEGSKTIMCPKCLWCCFRIRQWCVPLRLYLNLLDYIVTCMSVAIDGFWIDDSIYCTLRYSAWLHFTVHTHVFTSRCSVAASNDGHSLPFGSATDHNDWITLNNSVTHQPTNSTQLTDWSGLLITSRQGEQRKHSSSVAACGPLPSNGSTCHNIINKW
jgi:hypothetical protein